MDRTDELAMMFICEEIKYDVDRERLVRRVKEIREEGGNADRMLMCLLTNWYCYKKSCWSSFKLHSETEDEKTKKQTYETYVRSEHCATACRSMILDCIDR